MSSGAQIDATGTSRIREYVVRLIRAHLPGCHATEQCLLFNLRDSVTEALSPPGNINERGLFMEKNIGIYYFSKYGQTQKIAHFLSECFRDRDWDVRVSNAG